MGKTRHRKGRWWRCPHRYTIHKQCLRVTDDKGEIGRHLVKDHKYSPEERSKMIKGKRCPTVHALLGKLIGRKTWQTDFKAYGGKLDAPKRKKTRTKPKLAKEAASKKTPMKSTRGIAVHKRKTAAAKPKANTATKRAAKPKATPRSYVGKAADDSSS